jgi:uncharacterized protein YmfQ (DUF2313 family)
MGELIEGRLFAVNGIQVCGASLRRRSGQAFAKEAESGAGAIEFLESEAPELIFWIKLWQALTLPAHRLSCRFSRSFNACVMQG